MKKLLTLLFFLLMIFPARAHHPGHSGSQNANFFYQKGHVKPASLVSLYLDYSVLDESLGTTFSLVGFGEYAINHRFSLLIQAPFIGFFPDEASDTTGFGDVGLGLKGLFFSGQNFFLAGSALFTLPVGKENLSRESVGVNSSLFFGFPLKNWTLFFSPGVDFGFDSESDFLTDLILGVTTPPFLKNKIYFSFSTRARIFGSSENFETGSWKMYAEPQVRFIASKHVNLGLGFKFSVMDQLEVKDDVVITTSSTAIFNDMAWGMSGDVTYLF